MIGRREGLLAAGLLMAALAPVARGLEIASQQHVVDLLKGQDVSVASLTSEASASGALYIHDGEFTNSLSEADTYFQLTGFSTGLSLRTGLTASNMVVQVSGIYVLQQCMSVGGTTVAEANKTLEATFFISGEHQTEGEFSVKLGPNADVVSSSGTAILELSAGDTVDLRMKCIGSTSEILIRQAQFTMYRLPQ